MKSIVLIFILLGSLGYPNPGKETEENAVIESFQIMVLDANTEEPIPAAQIKIKQKDQEAYTDFDGFAEMKNITAGIYDIEISLVSYKNKLLKDFQLTQDNHQLLVRLHP
jgi:hypothetical protein